jgi:hypothetical protein
MTATQQQTTSAKASDGMFRDFYQQIRNEVESELANRSAELDRREQLLIVRERALEEREKEVPKSVAKEQSLFGTTKSSLFGEKEGNAKPNNNTQTATRAKSQEGALAQSNIDGSHPGSASDLKGKFERRITTEAPPAEGKQSTSLFGAKKSSLFGERESNAKTNDGSSNVVSTAAAKPQEDSHAHSNIDASNPGNASELKGKFERRLTTEAPPPEGKQSTSLFGTKKSSLFGEISSSAKPNDGTQGTLDNDAQSESKPSASLFGSKKSSLFGEKENNAKPNDSTQSSSLFKNDAQVEGKESTSLFGSRKSSLFGEKENNVKPNDSTQSSSLFKNNAQAEVKESTSLFGNRKSSLFGENDTQSGTSNVHSTAAAKSQEDTHAQSNIDGSHPGSASDLKGKFERRITTEASPSEGKQSTSLFGAKKSSLFGERETDVKTNDGMQSGSSNVVSAALDASNPGNATELKDKFERRLTTTEEAPRKSWQKQMGQVALPNGEGTTRVHIQGADGGAYKSKTSFSKPPPARKSFADLP